jgi:hypothetical protein
LTVRQNRPLKHSGVGENEVKVGADDDRAGDGVMGRLWAGFGPKTLKIALKPWNLAIEFR